MRNLVSYLVTVFVFLVIVSNARAGELDVLAGEIEGVKPDRMMQRYLLGRAEGPVGGVEGRL